MEGAIAGLGLNWTIEAAQAPYARENIGTEEEPVMQAVVIRPVPLAMLDHMHDLHTYDAEGEVLTTFRPTTPQAIPKNSGDNSWVWED